MTPLQKYLEKKRKSGVKLDPDSFGLFIDEFLHENDVEMLVKLPAGHEEPEIIDNIGAGPVLTFYLLLSCLAPVFHDLLKFLGERAAADKEKLADSLLELVRADMLREEETDD